jgi:hypothetical protein
VYLQKALLALAAVFRKGSGSVFLLASRFDLSTVSTLPAAKTGASFSSVFLLHAIGRPESRADNTWLTCGSVQPPLFAPLSLVHMLIPPTKRFKYPAFCMIVSVRPGN